MAATDPIDLSSLPGDPRALAGFLPNFERPVKVRLRWSPGANDDRGAWLADVYDDAGAVVLGGLRVVVTGDSWDLFLPHVVGRPELSRALRLRVAAGAVTADPGLRDLGAGVQMEVADRA